MSQKTDLDLPLGCAVQGAVRPGFESILTRGALEFVADLARKSGIHIGWKQHARIGIPVTLASLVLAWAWLH